MISAFCYCLVRMKFSFRAKEEPKRSLLVDFITTLTNLVGATITLNEVIVV